MTRQGDHDQIITTLAHRQYGIVSRAQLLAAGVPVHVIESRVRAKRLIVMYRGVYALGHQRLRPEGWWLAAVLASGSGAVLSHQHAALHWELVDRAPGPVHVSTPSRTGKKPRRGIRLHRVELFPGETLIREAIPVTSVARTILDMAATTRGRELEHLIRRASRRRRFDLTEQRALIARHPRHLGARPLAALLDRLRGRGTDDLRSMLEVFFAQLCDDNNLPRPLINKHVSGIRVDFHWPHARLIIETDGFDWHSMPTAFEDDRARDQRLALDGWTVLRFTYNQVTQERARVAETVLALLRRPLTPPPASAPPPAPARP